MSTEQSTIEPAHQYTIDTTKFETKRASECAAHTSANSAAFGETVIAADGKTLDAAVGLPH